MCCAFFMCRETTSGSNKAVSPPLRTPCAPVPRSHCTLASKCKHFRFAVDEPCCPHHIKKRATLCVVLFLCVGKQHRARTQPNGWRSAVACKRLRYAPCVTLQTLCVALLFILDLHYAEHALLSHVINCAFDQTNAFYLFVCLLLVYSFSPRVHSIPRGSPILKKAHQDDVLFLLYGTIYGREPNRTVDFRT